MLVYLVKYDSRKVSLELLLLSWYTSPLLMGGRYAVGETLPVLDSLGGVPREQKMLEGHIPRVIHQPFVRATAACRCCGARQGEGAPRVGPTSIVVFTRE